MIKLIVCESVADKYVFHEYRQKGDIDYINSDSLERVKETIEKDLKGKSVLFIMLTCLNNPFNFNREVISHGKVN